MTEHVTEKEKQLSVLHNADVVIVGGGIAGVSAALASARCGAKTLLVEREYSLGGLATLGLITIYLPICDGAGHQVIYGIGEELFKLSISLGAEADYPAAWLDGNDFEARVQQRFKVRYNPHLFSLLTEKLLLKEGVEILYGTTVCSAQTEGDRITALIAENKSGRFAITGRNFVDCSGDADLCARAGADTYVNPKGNGLASWYYSASEGKVNLNMFGLADVVSTEKNQYSGTVKTTALGTLRFSGVDGAELSSAVIEAHDRMLGDILKKREKNEDLVPVTISSIPLVRMSRRICGVRTLDDCDCLQRNEDSIGMTGDWTKRGPIYEIPYGTLYGDKLANLITAGRIISSSDTTWNVTRVIPPCAVTGEAAGTAAALFTDFRTADVKVLQDKLVENGVKLHISDVM